ncbi:membrane protein [Sinomonas atrocyanea]|uniref:Membrane protein n=1 Tax=Sinomonas atrocyanea TaxID=37927 RepID=A0A126ZYE4_9MICC|nr:membrane protein [Sinomonas atrocyanea]
MDLKEPQWRREGEMPDYRFSMANERTFLAWIRTSMAILAGSIAIDQLTPTSPRPPSASPSAWRWPPSEPS